MKSRIPISILLLLMFVFTGCISQSLEEAQVEFCQALVDYGQAVENLKEINADTTMAELQTASDDVTEARQAVADTAVDLRQAQVRRVEQAWEDTQSELNNISDDATLGEAAATIRSQAFILGTEIERVRNISCGRR